MGEASTRRLWKIAFLGFYCAFSGIVSIATLVFFARERSAPETTAIIIAVVAEDRYQVDFTRTDGVTCRGAIIAPASRLTGLEVGSRLPVRYLDCSNVRASAARGWWHYALVGPSLFAVGLVLAVRVTRPGRRPAGTAKPPRP